MISDFVKKEIESGDLKYRYMLLGRMKSDCLYYLGYGGRCEKFLWSGNVKDHIDNMKMIYNSFPEDKKPEWLTMEEIKNFEKEM